ncbi:MAG: GNAT family N-acetyltransferase [Pseudomonadota bacterium]
MPCFVRSLSEQDWDAWKRLWGAYLAFYETNRPHAVYETTFQRLLGTEGEDFSCFVAVSEGEIVGLTHFLFHRHCWSIENTCYLQDLFTAPEARGKGVATKLIEAVYHEADARGAASVYWLTQEDNLTARKVYDQVGVKTSFIKYTRSAAKPKMDLAKMKPLAAQKGRMI